MTSKTTTEITCDACQIRIDPKETHVNAGTYGVDLHVECYLSMSAHELVKIFELDEIKLMRHEDWERAAKIFTMDVNRIVHYAPGKQNSCLVCHSDLHSTVQHQNSTVDVQDILKSEYLKLARSSTYGVTDPPKTMDFENGKYTLVLHHDGTVVALRGGEPWRQFEGDKFMGLIARKLFGMSDDE